MNDDERAALGVLRRHFPRLDDTETRKLCEDIVFASDFYKSGGGDLPSKISERIAELAWARGILPRLIRLFSDPDDGARLRDVVERERRRANSARTLKKGIGPPKYVFVTALLKPYREASLEDARVTTDRNTGRIIPNKFTNFVQDAFDALCERLAAPEHASPSLDAIRRALGSKPRK